ncbi:hypothetical protein ACWGOK_00280 [Streptomyces eurythermus]|uniref:hypothetical protein n=1 Tax=Streptomyces eurythermus TaxID=42237 RepID=UPI0033FEB8E9
MPTRSVSVCGVDFVYRRPGPEKGGAPLILLHHLTAVLDDRDPASSTDSPPGAG